ncbi:MAG: hypothetical protein PVF05_06160 [Gemmatimonadales bacterium]|jgi:hypothetical protein
MDDLSEGAETNAGSSPGAATPEYRRRPHWARLGLELVVVFVGVTAAFFVEGYREQLDADRALRQAAAGILAELRTYQTKGIVYVDSMTAHLDAWEEADREGRRAVPTFFTIPGAPQPPTAAWSTAVASGVASGFEPDFGYRLGYFYNEFSGIQANYRRHLAFIENYVLPRAEEGVDAFYDAEGRFDPAVRSRMRLVREYVADLDRLSRLAGDLADELEARLEEGRLGHA